MIYVLQADVGGPVKIGWCQSSAEARMRELQCGNPWRLEIKHTRAGSRADESALHQRYRALRMPGGREWFTAYHPLTTDFPKVIASPTDTIDLISASAIYNHATRRVREEVNVDAITKARGIASSEIVVAEQQAAEAIARNKRYGKVIVEIANLASENSRPAVCNAIATLLAKARLRIPESLFHDLDLSESPADHARAFQAFITQSKEAA